MRNWSNNVENGRKGRRKRGWVTTEGNWKKPDDGQKWKGMVRKDIKGMGKGTRERGLVEEEEEQREVVDEKR